jgi:hypothetical protein
MKPPWRVAAAGRGESDQIEATKVYGSLATALQLQFQVANVLRHFALGSAANEQRRE